MELCSIQEELGRTRLSALFQLKVKEELANHPDLQSVTVGIISLRTLIVEISIAIELEDLSSRLQGAFDGKIVHKNSRTWIKAL